MSAYRRESPTLRYKDLANLRTGLAFDDVLLVPRYSKINSRRDADTSTRLTSNIALSIPIISANMDTVTEASMAVAIAREGGVGVIHRFMRLEEQVAQVQKVKRMESIVIETPYSLGVEAKLSDVRRLMREKNVGGILIVNDQGRLEGIITTRDIRFVTNPNASVSTLMTKRKDLVVGTWSKTTIEQAQDIMQDTRIEKLPLVDSKNRLRGLVTAKDILKRKEYPRATKDSKGRLRVGAAVGVKGDYLERAEKLAEADVDVLVLDIAHGHSQHAIDATKKIKKTLPETDLIAGNVATREGARDLINAGADSIKVGVGSGSICITRIVTGSGIPQLTAISDCSRIARDNGITLIADGGIRNSGDIAKSVVAGADTVMIGSLLAGTDESPGEIVFRGNQRYKVTRGMASMAARRDQLEKEGRLKPEGMREGEDVENHAEVDLSDYVPEGVEAIVPYKGGAVSVIRQLVGGLRSGMSYCGASNLKQMRANGKFIRITNVGIAESNPHDVITDI